MKNKFITKEITNRKKIYKKIKKKGIKNKNNLFFYGKTLNFEGLKKSVENYLSENIYAFSKKKYINLNKFKFFEYKYRSFNFSSNFIKIIWIYYLMTHQLNIL